MWLLSHAHKLHVWQQHKTQVSDCVLGLGATVISQVCAYYKATCCPILLPCSDCTVFGAGGCRVSVHPLGIWMLPRWTLAFTELLRP